MLASIRTCPAILLTALDLFTFTHFFSSNAFLAAHIPIENVKKPVISTDIFSMLAATVGTNAPITMRVKMVKVMIRFTKLPLTL
jgi:hypothetical protein